MKEDGKILVSLNAALFLQQISYGKNRVSLDAPFFPSQSAMEGAGHSAGGRFVPSEGLGMSGQLLAEALGSGLGVRP